MTSNRNLPLILFTLLLSSFLLAYYFYFIKPIKSESELKQNDILVAKEQVAVLEARKEAIEWETDAESDTDLLKKLPESRELTQVIQLIQEAELITESKVQTITFNDYEGEISESLISPEPVIEEEQQETSDPSQTEVAEPIEQSNSENDAENLAPVSEIALIPLPEELKLLTLEVTVEHKDYEQFLLFLKEVEQNERIIKIDSISLVLPGELIEPENLITITSTIQMTTFYMK